MYSSITIRDAAVTDITNMAYLMTELGYPTAVAEMQQRFNSIAQHPDYKTIIATRNNEVVGMAGLCKGIYYEMNGGYVRILALVVKQTARNLGIGKFLLAAAEGWAMEQGITTILINSGNREERVAAHQFYEVMGYAVKSSGFVKKL